MTPEQLAPQLVRRYLWRGVTPHPDRRGRWHIGRDLSIWRRLVRAGVDPAELNGAIAVMPEVAPSVRCMAPLASNRTGPALLARAVHRWHANQAPAPRRRPARSEPRRLQVELPGL